MTLNLRHHRKRMQEPTRMYFSKWSARMERAKKLNLRTQTKHTFTMVSLTGSEFEPKMLEKLVKTNWKGKNYFYPAPRKGNWSLVDESIMLRDEPNSQSQWRKTGLQSIHTKKRIVTKPIIFLIARYRAKELACTLTQTEGITCVLQSANIPNCKLR